MRLPRWLLFVWAVTFGCHSSRSAPRDEGPRRTDAALRCPGWVGPGLSIEIRDARSRRFIADSATAIARDGNFVDTLRVAALQRDGTVSSLAGVWDRAGTYVVQVTRPGYREWRDSGIVLTRGRCRVNLVDLRADLQPDH